MSNSATPALAAARRPLAIAARKLIVSATGAVAICIAAPPRRDDLDRLSGGRWGPPACPMRLGLSRTEWQPNFKVFGAGVPLFGTIVLLLRATSAPIAISIGFLSLGTERVRGPWSPWSRCWRRSRA
jgi:hypothetical protein